MKLVSMVMALPLAQRCGSPSPHCAEGENRRDVGRALGGPRNLPALHYAGRNGAFAFKANELRDRLATPQWHK